jgi:hypothetical protein
MTIDKFRQRQNVQISRIFAVKDPLVDVIYVCPFELSQEVIGYYTKVLEIGNVEQPETRFTIVVPDNAGRLPTTLPTSTLLLYSPKTLKRIRELLKGRPAYIVPGTTSHDDVKVSLALGIPVLCGEPQKAQLYSSKSGCRRIFNLADIPIAPSAYDLYSEKEFEAALAKLIFAQLHVGTWVFKMDDEKRGRGVAWLEVESIKAIKDLRKSKCEVNEKLLERVQQHLHKELPQRVRLATPTLYRTWEEFLKGFCQSGGVIEAHPNCPRNDLGSPTVSFLIEPDGTVVVVGACDRLEARPFIHGACVAPQRSLPSVNLSAVCGALGGALYQKGVMGHVTVDLLSFPHPSSEGTHPLFWYCGDSIRA